MKRVLVSVLAGITLFSFDARSAARKVALGQPFAIKIGQKVMVQDVRLKIKFLAVTSDSRCPEGVNCIQAGNAEVRLKVGRSGPVSLNMGTAPGEVKVGEFKIKLTALTPRPKKGAQIDPASYEATLIVTRE
jgi:hypothetical protein